MQYKLFIQLTSALTLAIVAVASAQVQTSQPQKNQKSQTSGSASKSYRIGKANTGEQLKNPMSPEMSKEFNAQVRRAHAVEQQARQFLKEHRLAEAEKACYRAVALSPKWNGQPMASTTFQLLDDIYLEQKRYHKVISLYSKAHKHTGNLNIDLNIALSYLKLGDLKNARKFYAEERIFGHDLPPQKRAAYLAQLPGTKTSKTMEASIYYARGCVRSSVADRTAAVENYKKALALVPRNALIASKCAWDLGSIYRGKEATPYWARAAVFGTGDIAKEGMRRLKNVLMPDKVEQALAEARKIKG